MVIGYSYLSISKLYTLSFTVSGTETLYFGDFLSVNKEWWQGSAPISRTLPHSKALAHWRQVRRNYLF